jgi:hypothetical protein
MGFFQLFSHDKSSKRVKELEERCERLERDMRGLKLDWENAYDKLRILMGRVAKRAEKMHEEAEDAGLLHPSSEAGPESAQIPLSPTWSRLTARQKTVQLQVLQRRAGLNGGK